MSFKLDCPRKEFFEAISMANGGSSARSTLPILQCLKLEAYDGGMRVLGCDGEMWVERSFSCMVHEPGSICLQSKLLADIVGSLPDGDIELVTTANQIVELRQGASEYKMMSLDAGDFPEPPSVVPDGSLTLPMGELRRAIDSVIFAVSTDTYRRVLTGVLFSYDGEVLTLVATDTHRLAVRRLEKPGVGSAINVVVPEKALKAIKNLPVAEDTPVTIEFGGGRLSVEAGGAKIVSQLLGGAFPVWKNVVPNETSRAWSVEVDQLTEKVRRVNILARDNAGRVRFSGSNQQILISARSEEKGEAKEEVEMNPNNGDIDVAFNGKYVLDALGPINGPGVRIELTESSRPAIFRPADEDDYFCVIMPMALA